jgi:hypothetical protein
MSGIEDNDLKFLNEIENFERRAGIQGGDFNSESILIKPPENYTFQVFNNNSRATLMMTKNKLTICNPEGSPVVHISLIDGSVKLEGTPDEAAIQFWKAVGQMYQTFIDR